MENVNYITNYKGEKIAIQVNLNSKKKLSYDEIEEIEDIIYYELVKNEPNVDYTVGINKLITKKKAHLV
jgi:divalent metal cation (Fe/Co/Zn/Cd) transporter